MICWKLEYNESAYRIAAIPEKYVSSKPKHPKIQNLLQNTAG